MNVDLTDVGLFEDGPPHDVFKQLRDESPVHWNEHAGFWSLTRFDDIHAANRDWETLSSARRGVTIEEGTVFPKELQEFVFIMMDPPEHDRHRAIVQKVFTPRAVREHEPEMRRVVNTLIDAVIARGECDLVEDIAVDFPLTVIADMLGVPAADRRKLFEWTNKFADTTVTPEEGTQLILEMGGYVGGLVAARRADPQDDLLSQLIAAEVDGESLSDFEVTAHFAQLMAAGNETTRNALAGGILALLENRSEWEKLVADPGLIPGAVEEILRWHSPLIYQARTATRDTEISGTAIRENDLVVLWFASGNRDERAFPDPDRFDVTRADETHGCGAPADRRSASAPRQQLAFGGGRHFCLGNQLARYELRVALEEIVRRMPDLELAGPAVRQPSNIFHWMRSLPVTFTPA